MSDDISKLSLIEALESVEPFRHEMVEIVPTHHRNIPYGRYCHEAAERIRTLERELAETQTVLRAWHESFGTSQLSHALAERDQLRAELAQQLEKHPQREAMMVSLRAELRNLTDDRDSWINQCDARVNDALQFARERDQLRAENERLKEQIASREDGL